MEFNVKFHVLLVFIALTATFQIGHSYGTYGTYGGDDSPFSPPDADIEIVPIVKTERKATIGTFRIPSRGEYLMQFDVEGTCHAGTEMWIEIMRRRDSKSYIGARLTKTERSLKLKYRSDVLLAGDKIVIMTTVSPWMSPGRCSIKHENFKVTNCEDEKELCSIIVRD